jgi:hypothetical protein
LYSHFFLQYLANAENLNSSWSVTCSKSHVFIPSLRSFILEIRPSPRLMFTFCNGFIFLWWRVVSPTPNPQAGGPPLVVCPQRAYSMYLQPTSIAPPVSATRERATLWRQGPT